MAKISKQNPLQTPLLNPTADSNESAAATDPMRDTHVYGAATMGAPPPDRFSIAYFAFFLLGAGMLYPWNVFINGDQYFHVRLCGTWFATTFENFFGISYNVVTMISLILCVKYQQHYSIRTRIVVGLSVVNAVFFLTAALVWVPPSTLSSIPLFILTILSILISGFFAGILQGGAFALAAVFPSKYTQAIMTGQALAGSIVASSAIITTATSNEVTPCSSDEDEEYRNVRGAAFAYFMSACVILILCTIIYYVLEALPITRFYVAAAKMAEDRGAVGRDAADEEEQDKRRLISTNKDELSDQVSDQTENSQSDYDVDPDTGAPLTGDALAWAMLYRIRWMAISVWFVFTVTLSLFPAVTVELVSTTKSGNRFYRDLFVPFFFLLFNLGDFSGRLTAGIKRFISASMLPYVVAARLVFLPLFLLCNVGGPSVLFHADAWPILFMALMAMSNGYCASLSMMYGPSMVKLPHAGTAATIMAFALAVGLFCGTLLSFALIPFAKGGEPISA